MKEKQKRESSKQEKKTKTFLLILFPLPTPLPLLSLFSFSLSQELKEKVKAKIFDKIFQSNLLNLLMEKGCERSSDAITSILSGLFHQQKDKKQILTRVWGILHSVSLSLTPKLQNLSLIAPAFLASTPLLPFSAVSPLLLSQSSLQGIYRVLHPNFTIEDAAFVTKELPLPRAISCSSSVTVRHIHDDFQGFIFI